jgi:hypothetical protein
VSYTAIDVIEEKLNTKSTELYLGLLSSLEDMAVYGYVTDTKTKFMLQIALQDTTIKDQDVKTVTISN